jgi:glycosyltransferase involved in cell wall biosynthesis
MRILIVNCVYDPEPVVSAQIGKSLAEKLVAEGHTVSVISPFPTRPSGFRFDTAINTGKIEHRIIEPNLDHSRLPSYTCPKSSLIGRLYESLSFGLHAYRYIVKHSDRIDKVYMNTWPLFGQYGVSRACKKTGVPYVVHIQDVYPESITNKLPGILGKIIYTLIFPFEKRVMKMANKIIVISQKMKTFVAGSRGIAEDKIEVVMNWQDDAEFDAYKERWNSGKLTFMYLGNMGPVAGLPLVMKAFINARVDAKLVLAGNGSKKQECMEISKKNPDIDIEFWEVPMGEVAKAQSQAHVLLLPIIKGAASSSIPSKLPAYMFSARPILCLADHGSDTANAIINADCGWVGNAEDVEWLTKSIIDISKMDKEKLKLLGANGRDFCLQNFSKEVNLNKLILGIIND